MIGNNPSPRADPGSALPTIESSGIRLDAQAVVHRAPKLLLAPEVALGLLGGPMETPATPDGGRRAAAVEALSSGATEMPSAIQILMYRLAGRSDENGPASEQGENANAVEIGRKSRNNRLPGRGARLALCIGVPPRVTRSRMECAMDFHQLVRRVRSEFNEMPGLRLTPAQAARLLGLDQAACQRVIDALVGVEFLRRAPDGSIILDAG